MSASSLLRRVVTHENARQDFRVLDALAGKSICAMEFFATEEEVKAAIHRALPLFVVPIGRLNGDLACVHTRPEDVAAGRTAVVLEGPGYVEVAPSIAGALTIQLAIYEEGGSSTFREGIEAVKAALDKDFYVPFGNLKGKKVHAIAAEKIGGWAEFYVAEAVGESAERKQELYEQGVKVAPNTLLLYARLCGLYQDGGDEAKAAAAAAAGLDCLEHTAYTTDLDEFYDRAAELAAKHPEAFAERHHRVLKNRSEKERLVLVTQAMHEGDFAWAAKLLCDLGHHFSFYNEEPMPTLFRKQFEKLGWKWAEALLDQREPHGTFPA